ncbi:DUF211 domain-containing protein [Halobium salinum]|uniref:DUF211 domain-containing protein n=1 Tax=Halobium salinum TaxID=1364940 RepID=A0ABD5P9X1_9EURY|nr:DUF211 domain-containing protein [Halobium salinum]
MADVTRLVLDLLKPHDPDLVEFSNGVAESPSVEGLNTTLIETDREVQNVKLTVEGDAVDAAEVEAAVEDLGGTVHSIDEVTVGDRPVQERPTPQDRR